MRDHLNVLIVDDHAIVREGLKRVLESKEPGWTILEADTGAAAIEVQRRTPVDVAVVDLSMPGMGGLEFLQRVRPHFPDLRVLILSMHAEEQYAMRAFKCGANGYVTKDCAARDLADAVRKVASGGTYVSAHLAEQMVRQLGAVHDGGPRLSMLSNRELEVLRGLVAGYRPTEIARSLHLSVKTVSTHKSRMMERLQIPNTAALIRFAMREGLTGPELPASSAAPEETSGHH